MSGMVGLIDLDGGRVDRDLLRRMTAFLEFRGPDASDVWIEGGIGLGHTLLRTVFTSESEKQPYTPDGETWIAADARIDGRGELTRKLASSNETDLKGATDAELILHSYREWGEGCLQHLIGDFAFAIWDVHQRRLFCARDHFGIKPFFYALTKNCLLFSNTLDCLRIHPDISDEPDEAVIADYLLFSMIRHPDSSAFDDIKRLPPAHYLTWSKDDGIKIHPYWKLQTQKLIRYRHGRDYIEHFMDLMHQAVGDRLRTDRICAVMSGGLDSTTVAAFARDILPTQTEVWDLRACTFIYEQLVPYDEGLYSQEVATALGIPLCQIPSDEEEIRWGVSGDRFMPPEPSDEVLTGRSITQILNLLTGFRVGLTGQGGDPALHPAPSHQARFTKSLLSGRLLFDISRYYLTHGRFPRMGIRKCIRRWLARGEDIPPPPLPPWLNENFSVRLDLPGRWRAAAEEDTPVDSLRSQAYQFLRAPVWVNLFESYDAGFTGTAVELRHPYFDLRLLNYLLALPPVPWCVDKELLRRAMVHKIPEPVISRPKTPLSGSPIFEILKRDGVKSLDKIAATPHLERFVDTRRFIYIAENLEKLRPEEYELITRPIGLALWLNRPKPA